MALFAETFARVKCESACFWPGKIFLRDVVIVAFGAEGESFFEFFERRRDRIEIEFGFLRFGGFGLNSLWRVEEFGEGHNDVDVDAEGENLAMSMRWVKKVC